MSALSPYHLPALHEDELAQRMQLELVSSHARQPGGLLFKDVAETLELASREKATRQKNLVVGLVDAAIRSRPENPVLEVYALLRVLLPEMDIASVYGFKTSGLLKSFAKAMEKNGGLSGKAAASQLMGWKKEPKPVQNGDHLVTMPETAIAMAQSKCFGAAQGKKSLVEVVAFCQKLTNIYKEKHKISLSSSLSFNLHVDNVAEALGEVLPALSYVECKVLVKLLLRTLPMGIGPQTVLQALGPRLERFLQVQRDIPRLAISTVQQTPEPPGLLCGVPFTPMTCHVTSSPYLMKYLFTKEDTIQRYLTPKDGRLIIHSSGAWYVPLKGSSSAMRNRFVDLESSAAMETKNAERRKHMLIMREVRRGKDFIHEEAAWGYLTSYMLYREEEDKYVLLLRALKPLARAGIEFADASVVMDDPKQKRLEHDLERMVARRGEALALHMREERPLRLRVLTDGMMDKGESNKKKAPEGLIVQRKMDGDRMQAHIMTDPQGKPMVKLFTKKGRPVHMLYGDVAHELEMRNAGMQDLPCILDGEIIVVDDKDGQPLPWTSSKWRYDSGHASSRSLSSLLQAGNKEEEDGGAGVVSIVNSASYGYNPADGEDGMDLTFAPDAHALSLWGELGTSDKKRLRIKRGQEGASLLFVVFDLLMLKGRPTIHMPYGERLDKLKKMQSLSRLKHTRVIAETWMVQNSEELIDKLAHMVRVKGEGLILKDPRAKYEFKRSLHQRKLKISGPDVNCGVAGVGFTQSRNPRLWGLLTIIRSDDRSKLLVYNRVESLEGDRLKTAGEHILGLSSLVSLDRVMHHSSKEKPIRKHHWEIYAEGVAHHQSPFSVTWQSTSAECTTVHFMQGAPKDIQWLCNPLECKFGISQRGDLYPVVWRGAEDAAAVSMLVPRFPVGRIQLDDHHSSELDTPHTIENKFKEAADEKTCIQASFTRKINELRSRPPRARKLEEVRRILSAKENPKENWPQSMPTMYRLDHLSLLLTQNGFQELNAGERMVLAGMKEASLWDALKIKYVDIPPAPDAEDFEAKRHLHLKRFKALAKRFKKPFLWATPTLRTACNMLQQMPLVHSPPSEGIVASVPFLTDEEEESESDQTENDEDEAPEYHDTRRFLGEGGDQSMLVDVPYEECPPFHHINHSNDDYYAAYDGYYDDCNMQAYE